LAQSRPPQRRSSEYLAGLAHVVEQLPAIVWTTDTALRFTYMAGGALGGIGEEAAATVGHSYTEFIADPGERERLRRLYTQALAGDDVVYEIVYHHRAFTCQLAPLRDASGGVIGTIGVAIDVTDAHRAADATRRSEAHYQALVEDAPVGIFRSSAAGRFLTVNRALVHMLGYESETELLGLDLAADVYVEPALRSKLTSQYAAADHVTGVDVEWRRKDGARITVRLSGQPVRNERGEVEEWEMVAEDVTERRRLETQLQTAQKMEALGLVTGGVAHDFNNLLTTILANAELINAALPSTMQQIRSDLLEIQDAAARGSDLVKKLLGFSRRERLTMQSTDVAAVVQEMVHVLRRLVPERIRVHVDAQEDLRPVLADTGALQQILLNLATNSRDAIAEQGDIWISAERRRLDEAHLAEFGWGTPGDYVAIRVRDSGFGMTEETRRRVFDPFFTTKPPGAGSGLGLAMVYGLMKQQNGFVGIASVPGGGTTVTLYLPITGRRTPTPHRPEPSHRTGAYILVVEDEEPIRRVAKRVLERHGYKVLAAADGVEALNQFREHEAEVALVLTDVVMPRMGGKALLEQLRGEGKRVPVVFMSGYAARGDSPEDAHIEPGMTILAKPWTVDQLLARVREVVGQA